MVKYGIFSIIFGLARIGFKLVLKKEPFGLYLQDAMLPFKLHQRGYNVIVSPKNNIPFKLDILCISVFNTGNISQLCFIFQVLTCTFWTIYSNSPIFYLKYHSRIVAIDLYFIELCKLFIFITDHIYLILVKALDVFLCILSLIL